MIEDKLTHDERLRLECVAQAVQMNAMRGLASAEGVVDAAKTFEAYVRTGDSAS